MHDEQTNSLENQRRLASDYIKRHAEELELAEPLGTYSERESGKSDVRKRYSAMLDRLEEGDISYILVKDLKRLNRSSESSAKLRSLCKRHGILIILLATGQVYDPNSENNRLIYGVESIINEEMVFKQSEYGRIAHRQKMEAKRLNANNCTIAHGWSKERHDMYVLEERAEVIRKIFDMYVFEDKSFKEIQDHLSGIGWHYSVNTISKWLCESAFIGLFHMNKKGSELGVGVGQRTRRYDNPKEDWVEVERPDLAIVPKDIFELAQRIRESRKRVYVPDRNGVHQARFQGWHLFASKIYCGECGLPYDFRYSDRACTIGVYKDSFAWKKNRKEGECINASFKKVYEEDMKGLVTEAINRTISGNQRCFGRLLETIKEVLEGECSQDGQIGLLKNELDRLEQKGERIRGAYIEASGAIRAGLASDYEEICRKSSDIQKQIESLRDEKDDGKAVAERIEAIGVALGKIGHIEELDRSTVNHFIHKIFIYASGDVDIMLNGCAPREQPKPQGMVRKADDSRVNIHRHDRSGYYKSVKNALCDAASGKGYCMPLFVFKHPIRYAAKGEREYRIHESTVTTYISS